jgi:hypothetical protein
MIIRVPPAETAYGRVSEGDRCSSSTTSRIICQSRRYRKECDKFGKMTPSESRSFIESPDMLLLTDASLPDGEGRVYIVLIEVSDVRKLPRSESIKRVWQHG